MAFPDDIPLQAVQHSVIHSSAGGHSGCSPSLETVSNAAVVAVEWRFTSCSLSTSRTGIAGSYVCEIAKWFSNHAILHSHQLHSRVLPSPTPHQYLLSSFLFVTVAVEGWSHSWMWLCFASSSGWMLPSISPRTADCMFARILWRNAYSHPLSFWHWVLRTLYEFWIKNLLSYVIYLSLPQPPRSFVLLSLPTVSSEAQVLNLGKAQLTFSVVFEVQGFCCCCCCLLVLLSAKDLLLLLSPTQDTSLHLLIRSPEAVPLKVP